MAGRPAFQRVRTLPADPVVIQPGDTLLSISFDQQMMAWKILQANPGLDANKTIRRAEADHPFQERPAAAAGSDE